MKMERHRNLTRLILLQVRDGAAPAELSDFTRGEILSIAANLIDEEYADGAVARGERNQVIAAEVQGLKIRGFDLLSTLEKEHGQESAKKNGIEVVISHSSNDKSFAEALGILLQTALNVPSEAIRCVPSE